MSRHPSPPPPLARSPSQPSAAAVASPREASAAAATAAATTPTLGAAAAASAAAASSGSDAAAAHDTATLPPAAASPVSLARLNYPLAAQQVHAAAESFAAAAGHVLNEIERLRDPTVDPLAPAQPPPPPPLPAMSISLAGDHDQDAGDQVDDAATAAAGGAGGAGARGPSARGSASNLGSLPGGRSTVNALDDAAVAAAAAVAALPGGRSTGEGDAVQQLIDTYLVDEANDLAVETTGNGKRRTPGGESMAAASAGGGSSVLLQSALRTLGNEAAAIAVEAARLGLDIDQLSPRSRALLSAGFGSGISPSLSSLQDAPLLQQQQQEAAAAAAAAAEQLQRQASGAQAAATASFLNRFGASAFGTDQRTPTLYGGAGGSAGPWPHPFGTGSTGLSLLAAGGISPAAMFGGAGVSSRGFTPGGATGGAPGSYLPPGASPRFSGGAGFAPSGSTGAATAFGSYASPHAPPGAAVGTGFSGFGAYSTGAGAAVTAAPATSTAGGAVPYTTSPSGRALSPLGVRMEALKASVTSPGSTGDGAAAALPEAAEAEDRSRRRHRSPAQQHGRPAAGSPTAHRNARSTSPLSSPGRVHVPPHGAHTAQRAAARASRSPSPTATAAAAALQQRLASPPPRSGSPLAQRMDHLKALAGVMTSSPSADDLLLRTGGGHVDGGGYVRGGGLASPHMGPGSALSASPRSSYAGGVGEGAAGDKPPWVPPGILPVRPTSPGVLRSTSPKPLPPPRSPSPPASRPTSPPRTASPQRARGTSSHHHHNAYSFYGSSASVPASPAHYHHNHHHHHSAATAPYGPAPGATAAAAAAYYSRTAAMTPPPPPTPQNGGTLGGVQPTTAFPLAAAAAHQYQPLYIQPPPVLQPPPTPVAGGGAAANPKMVEALAQALSDKLAARKLRHTVRRLAEPYS